MTDLKYSKYFLDQLTDDRRFKGFGKMPAMVAFTDSDIIEGSRTRKRRDAGQNDVPRCGRKAGGFLVVQSNF
jgi:hypothetical protein